jgi:diguanylate cyclase (GGDEF)-like protein/PAS domain S-box-containing protein
MRSKILDYFDFEKANTLLDDFNRTTGFVAAILDLDGNILSQSGWREICTDFHRVHPDTAKNCRISDIELANSAKGGEKYHFYQCLNGLIDVRAPIVIRGEHIANLYSGQFLFKDPDVAFFKKQAAVYGFDEPSYLAALAKVPVVSREKVEATMNFLLDIIQIIIDLTAEKMEQMALNQVIRENEKALLDHQVQLEHSEERYRQLSEQSRTYTWEVDVQGLYTFVDQASETVLGYRPEELIQKKYFYDLCPEEEREALIKDAFATFQRKDRFRDFVNTALTKDGAGLILSTNGLPILNEDGTLRGYRGSDTDITARKQAEDALIHSHDLMRYIIEHNRSAVAVHDRELRYLYVSQRYLDEYKVNGRDIIGKHHYEIFPNLPEKWREVHQRALKGEISSAEKDFYVGEDGSVEWTRWECRPWYEKDGSIGGIIVYTEIITDHVRLLNDLKSSEQNLKSAQKIAHVGSFDYDASCNKLTFSDEGSNIFGIAQKEFSGAFEGILRYIHPAEKEHLRELWHKAENERRVMEFELRIIRQDGQEGTVDIRIGPVFDENGKWMGNSGTIQDITERKKAEAKLIYISTYDQLTDLYNRRYYEEMLTQFDTTEQLPLSVIVADINGLKLFNDSFGDMEGNKIIMQAARILSSCCRNGDILARTGGDEFSILLPGTSYEAALRLVKRIQDVCKHNKFSISNEDFQISISLGAATKEAKDEDFAQVSKKAEDYMNQRKLLEKNSSYSSIISSISATMLEKSHETKEHSERIARLSRRVGSILELSTIELDQIELLATLHDIGKVGVAEQILKKPDKLTSDEWIEMKKHPEIGYRIAMSHEEALAEIKRCAGTQFDPSVAQVFMDAVNSGG